jgi:hypothetical protein
MLTEDQIQRYARHLLLPGVGSAGQEALLATEAKLQGEEPWAGLCGDYLAAAGLAVDAHSGPGLCLRAGPWTVSVQVSGATAALHVTACAACAPAPQGPLTLELGPVAATLAAAELLRRLLGLAQDASAWTITAQGLRPLAAPPCPHAGPR